ncbi:MAG: class I SAM-dependent methyltransferase [Dehalococcoidia bacterium]|nr:class I SAM-dependent methyltransferase [Dehalococcoidia bacterium]
MKPEGHRWFAATYALQTRFTERGRMLEARRRLLAGLRGDVLEIGAGTGANFAHYPPEARVIAIEPDPHMLRRAQATLAALPARNIDVRLAPAEHLPFDDASFDAAVTTLVLCSVGDLAQSLAELRRVLRPGGELRFMEHVRGEGALVRVQSLAQPVWGWCAAGCHLDRRIEDALRAAGFEISSLKHSKLAPWLPMIRGVATAPSPAAADATPPGG